MGGESTIRMRVRRDGDRAEIRALIRHPMETGNRIGRDGAPVPAHYIREVTCAHNGEVVLRGHWGTGISKNPYLGFELSGVRRGDRIVLSWRDNRGASDELAATVG